MKTTNFLLDTRRGKLGGSLFWLLIAPVCALLDSRFRRYAASRRYLAEEQAYTRGVSLPNRNSITSWVVRDQQPWADQRADVRRSKAGGTWLM